MGSYAGGLATGANILFNADQNARANRLLDERLKDIPGGPHLVSPRRLPAIEMSRPEGSETFQAGQRRLNNQAQARYDAQAEAEAGQRAQKQATAYDRAVQALVLGVTNPIVDYLNQFGDPELNVEKIERGADGKITVYPATTQGTAEVNGQPVEIEKTSPAFAPMTFASDADFYAKFLGQLKPQGAQAAIAQPEKEKQKWQHAGNEYTGLFVYEENGGASRRLTDPLANGGRVKDDESVAGGRGGSRGGKGLDNDAYKLFDDHLNKQFLAEFQAALPPEQKEMAEFMESDAFGNQRVAMERVVAKMSPEMRLRYNNARQHGENFMTDGSVTPIMAANKAYQYANQPKVENPGGNAAESYATIDAKDQTAVQQVSQHLATLPVEQYDAEVKAIRRDNPDLVSALVAQRKKAGGRSTDAVAKDGASRGGRQSNPAAPQSPVDVLGQMSGNIPRDTAITKVNTAPVALVQNGLNQLADYFVVEPAKAAASDIAQPFQAFQKWAQTRYKTPGAEKSPQALAEYAKVDPEGAQKIQLAAAQFAR